jgi:hypothetical protein
MKFYKSLLKQARQFLNDISDNNMIEFLKSMLTPYEIMEIASRQKNVLIEFGKIFEQTSSKNKHKFIRPVKKAGFSFTEAHDLNFGVSKWLWDKCMDHSIRQTGGRKKHPAEIIKALNSHIDKDSYVASNRYLKKINECAMYRHYAMRNHFTNFPAKRTSEAIRQKSQYGTISYSSFYRYASKKYKKPHRLTDMCKWCELNKVN